MSGTAEPAKAKRVHWERFSEDITMANASKKQIGAGSQGKGTGTGAMTETNSSVIGENMVLSNRDKAAHSDQRGQDSRWVQTEQRKDHVHNRREES